MEGRDLADETLVFYRHGQDSEWARGQFEKARRNLGPHAREVSMESAYCGCQRVPGVHLLFASTVVIIKGKAPE